MAEAPADAAAPQSQLPAGWQLDLHRTLSYIMPMLSAELRITFMEVVKSLKAKKDAREIPSVSAALMEQAPQVVGADLWQQWREEAVRQAAAAGAPAAAVRQAAAGAPAPPPREADVIDPTDDALDDILNLAPRCARGGKNPLRVAVALKRKAQKECDEAREETKRVQARKGVAVLSTTTECYERIDQLERRLTKFADYCIELGANPADVNELRYGPI